MTPPLDVTLSSILATGASPTAVATSVPASNDACWSHPRPAGHPSLSSLSPAWPAIVVAAEAQKLVRSRQQSFLFAHASADRLTSRTRGFVQHVV